MIIFSKLQQIIFLISYQTSRVRELTYDDVAEYSKWNNDIFYFAFDSTDNYLKSQVNAIIEMFDTKYSFQLIDSNSQPKFILSHLKCKSPPCLTQLYYENVFRLSDQVCNDFETQCIQSFIDGFTSGGRVKQVKSEEDHDPYLDLVGLGGFGGLDGQGREDQVEQRKNSYTFNADGVGSNLETLTTSNFNEKTKDKHVFVIFQAEWSKQAQYIMKLFNEYAVNARADVMQAKMDAYKNELPEQMYVVDEIPSLQLIENEYKYQPIVQKKGFSRQHWDEFMKDYLGEYKYKYEGNDKKDNDIVLEREDNYDL